MDETELRRVLAWDEQGFPLVGTLVLVAGSVLVANLLADISWPGLATQASPLFADLLSWIIPLGGMLVLLLTFKLIYRKKPFGRLLHLHTHPSPKAKKCLFSIALGAVICPAIICLLLFYLPELSAISLFGSVSPISDDERQWIQHAYQGRHWASLVAGVFIPIFAVSVLGPLIEEILFRGIFFGSLAARFGAEKALLGSAVLFALAHLPLLQASPLVVAGLFVLYFLGGLYLAALQLRHRCLWVPICFHSLFNVCMIAYIIGTSLSNRTTY